MMTYRCTLIFVNIPQVLDVENEVQLRFLTATTKPGIYTWPQHDDLSWQDVNDIIGVLSNPTLLPGRGILLQFNEDELEKCRNLVKD